MFPCLQSLVPEKNRCLYYSGVKPDTRVGHGSEGGWGKVSPMTSAVPVSVLGGGTEGAQLATMAPG